jgi:hypothetical protein
MWIEIHTATRFNSSLQRDGRRHDEPKDQEILSIPRGAKRNFCNR